MVIMEESNLPQPRCPLCYMLVPWRAMNGVHWRTAQCKRGVDKKRPHLSAEEYKAVPSRSFNAYGRPLEILTYF